MQCGVVANTVPAAVTALSSSQSRVEYRTQQLCDRRPVAAAAAAVVVAAVCVVRGCDQQTWLP